MAASRKRVGVPSAGASIRHLPITARIPLSAAASNTASVSCTVSIVSTEVVPGKTVSTLREDFRHIDLPVFREVPARPPDRAVSAVDDMSAQQQQQ